MDHFLSRPGRRVRARDVNSANLSANIMYLATKRSYGPQGQSYMEQRQAVASSKQTVEIIDALYKAGFCQLFVLLHVTMAENWTKWKG